MAITGIDVISVPVSDQDRAKRFYTDVLGFAATMDDQLGPDMRWVMLRPPGAAPFVTLVTWFDSMPAGSLRGSVLVCDDLDKTLEELQARGLQFNEAEVQVSPWGRWKTFADPDGNGWVLQQNADR